MSGWWWLLLAPVAYALIGYACAWRETVEMLAMRERCQMCRKLKGACGTHEVETVPVVILWPLWVAAVVLGMAERAWERIDPARIVEERAERARMHVIVPGEKRDDA